MTFMAACLLVFHKLFKKYSSFYPRFLTESSKSPAYCSSQLKQGTYLIRLNLCIICSMVCIALKVLDWYNLYMDFAAYDDKCKYPCSYRKDFEQLKNDK